jgi:hypothetical protein
MATSVLFENEPPQLGILLQVWPKIMEGSATGKMKRCQASRTALGINE